MPTSKAAIISLLELVLLHQRLPLLHWRYPHPPLPAYTLQNPSYRVWRGAAQVQLVDRSPEDLWNGWLVQMINHL